MAIKDVTESSIYDEYRVSYKDRIKAINEAINERNQLNEALSDLGVPKRNPIAEMETLRLILKKIGQDWNDYPGLKGFIHDLFGAIVAPRKSELKHFQGWEILVIEFGNHEVTITINFNSSADNRLRINLFHSISADTARFVIDQIPGESVGDKYEELLDMIIANIGQWIKNYNS